MSNARHTTGEWKSEGNMIHAYPNTGFMGAPSGAVKIAKIETLACIGGSGDVAAQRACDQEQANARLIAAAPELLAALEAFCGSTLYGHVELAGRQEANELFQKARAAIRKAKGEK